MGVLYRIGGAMAPEALETVRGRLGMDDGGGVDTLFRLNCDR